MQALAEKPRKLALHPGWVAFAAVVLAVPMGALKMKKLQDRLIPAEQGGNIGLLSISVDPERDTPQKLKQYGQIFGARAGLWRSLTGDQQEVERTVVRGFHTAMAKVPRDPADPHLAAFEIMHGERLVLVDRMGRIRGYYDADDRAALEAHGGGLRRVLALPGGILDPVFPHRRPPVPGAVPDLLSGAPRDPHSARGGFRAADPAHPLALGGAQELPAAQALGRLDVPRVGVRLGHRRGRVLDALPIAGIEDGPWPIASSRPASAARRA